MDLLTNISIEIIAVIVEIIILIPLVGWWIQRGQARRLRPFLHQVAFDLDSRAATVFRLVIRYAFPDTPNTEIPPSESVNDVEVARQNGQKIKALYTSSVFAFPKIAISAWPTMSENINLITILAEFHQNETDLNAFAHQRINAAMIKSTLKMIRKMIRVLSPNYKSLNKKHIGRDFFMIDGVDSDRLVAAIELLKEEVSVVQPSTLNDQTNA